MGFVPQKLLITGKAIEKKLRPIKQGSGKIAVRHALKNKRYNVQYLTLKNITHLMLVNSITDIQQTFDITRKPNK